jgi:hypothetical protein
MLRHWLCWVGIAAALGSARPASAVPRFICYTVQQGDTAAEIARRVTGDARNRHDPWFQILDPATSRLIPKTEYQQIHPGWRVCLAEGMIGVTPIQQPAAPIWKKLAGMVFAIGWWWVPLLCSGAALVGTIAQSYSDRRQATLATLERFGNTFVREFQRPLVQQPGGDPPLRSQLRMTSHGERLEVLLAPNEGGRYPNLADHRKNVEYDVERVVTLLDDKRFVCGQLAARGSWVVIPFRLNANVKQGGGA